MSDQILREWGQGAKLDISHRDSPAVGIAPQTSYLRGIALRLRGDFGTNGGFSVVRPVGEAGKKLIVSKCYQVLHRNIFLPGHP